MVKLHLIAPSGEGLLKGNPYALLHLGEWVSRYSMDVSIVQDLDEVECGSYVGISVTTPTYQKGLELARKLKEDRGVTTILGGYHTKGQGIIISRHPEIDHIVEGEGEKGLLKILLGSKDRIVYGEPLNSRELDSVTVEDLINLDPEYFRTMRQFGRMNYISTRGCPFSCSFCASRGRLSTKSTDRIVDDLEKLSEFRHISIQDNYFGYSPKRIKEICKGILDRGIDVDWDCQTRVESMQDEEMLRLMAAAGCSAAYIGTENFHPEALKKMNKTNRPEQYLQMTKNAIKNMSDIGIKPYLNLQVGLPYESEEIRAANLDALQELDVDLYPHLNVIYPGTPDFYNLVKRGVPEDIFEYLTEEEDKVKELLEDNKFVHGSGGIPLGIIDLASLKKRNLVLDEQKVKEVNDYMQRIRRVARIYT